MKNDYESPKALLFVIAVQDILTGSNDLEDDWKSLKPELEKI